MRNILFVKEIMVFKKANVIKKREAEMGSFQIKDLRAMKTKCNPRLEDIAETNNRMRIQTEGSIMRYPSYQSQ